MAKTASGLPATAVDTAVQFARQARTLPVGALLGLSLGMLLSGVLYYGFDRRIPGWLAALAIPFCIAAGIGVQKLLHWKYGWKVDTELERARIRHETDLKLSELRDRLAAGVLTPEQAQRIGAQIAREGLLGKPRPRGPRPPRRPRSPINPPQPPETPLKPAA